MFGMGATQLANGSDGAGDAIRVFDVGKRPSRRADMDNVIRRASNN
jgi:hypothetical protein